MIAICLISCCFLFQVVVDGGVNVPVSIIPQLKVKAKGYFKKKTVPPKAVKRHTRGPVYLKFVPVDYDKAQGKLKLPPGEFAGSSVHRAAGDEHDTENSQTALAFEDEDNNLAGRHIHGLSHQVRDRLLNKLSLCYCSYNSAK